MKNRQICETIDPKTQETDWFEPDNVNQLTMQPKYIDTLKEKAQPIEFKFDNNNEDKTISIEASFQFLKSEKISVPEEEFAKEFAKAVYADELIDEVNYFISLKNKAIENLSSKLLDNDVIAINLTFKGIGFVYSKASKIMTIETIQTLEDNKIKLVHCVGPIDLTNVENPTIKFYTGNHLLDIDISNVKTESTSNIKTYLVDSNINCSKNKESIIKYKKFQSLSSLTEDEVASFIADRFSMLDMDKEEELDVDDILDNIF